MDQVIFPASAVDKLLDAVRLRGFRPVGPVVRDGAICYGDIASAADLPAGWTDEQDAAAYRLKRRDDGALFGYAAGPDSWKKYLFRRRRGCCRRSHGRLSRTPSSGCARATWPRSRSRTACSWAGRTRISTTATAVTAP